MVKVARLLPKLERAARMELAQSVRPNRPKRKPMRRETIGGLVQNGLATRTRGNGRLGMVGQAKVANRGTGQKVMQEASKALSGKAMGLGTAKLAPLLERRRERRTPRHNS